ncbi:hypothetical protein BT69DRAFT_1275758, partial [Atractiella rhizophila]
MDLGRYFSSNKQNLSMQFLCTEFLLPTPFYPTLDVGFPVGTDSIRLISGVFLFLLSSSPISSSTHFFEARST